MTECSASARLAFHDADETFIVDFSRMTFTSAAQVDAFYDEVDRQLAGSGRHWYFLVDYSDCVIAPEAWDRFAERGKRTNIDYGLGTVRVGATSTTRAAIRQHAEGGVFRPNIFDTRADALRALAEMRGKRNRFRTATARSTLFVRTFSVTTAAIVALFVAMYFLSVPFIRTTVGNIEERSARLVLDDVCRTLESIHRDLQGYRQSLVLARKQELEHIIAVVETRATWLDGEVKAGRLARAKARSMLLDELRRIHYGRNDYVWAADFRSVLISHPDPKLNNADFSARQDVRGNLIVPPMVAGARASGSGYYSYWWRRLGDDRPIEKLSYYKLIPGFDLVIGTGVYVDDVETMVDSMRIDAIGEMRQRLMSTRIARTGYVYVFDSLSNVHIHPNGALDGKNIADMIEPSTRKPIIPMLIAVADKAEGVRYLWDTPEDPGHFVHEKTSWVRYSSEFDWYVAASVYSDELNESARTLGNRLLEVFSVTLLISIALIFLFVKRLTDPLKALSATAQRVEEGDLDARCQVQRDDEIGLVANAFNGMVGRLQDNFRHLDARVMERTAELEKANEELKELDQLKSNFLSTVSHELRTPMTSIVGFVKLVKKKLEEVIFPRVVGDDKTARAIGQVRQNLDVMIGESERLTLLINDVLDSAKLDAGKVAWNLVPLAPAALIEKAGQVAEPLAAQKGLTLNLEIASDLPKIMGDKDRLHQVLINLLSNAVKFTERGTVVLRAERAEGFVRFAIRDSGIGIAPEQQEKIFDKFNQIGDTLTDKPQGTGLGLSICRHIVRHHGGEIWLDSAPGVGTTFHFTVPLAVDDDSPRG